MDPNQVRMDYLLTRHLTEMTGALNMSSAGRCMIAWCGATAYRNRLQVYLTVLRMKCFNLRKEHGTSAEGLGLKAHKNTGGTARLRW